MAKPSLKLLGLDRSGPAPPETAAGRPLRPWTVPNAIGFARLALIPAFLVSAFSSAHGTGALPATLFAVIGWGDYADGIAARLTRQYSRLGALMDPFTDRLLVVRPEMRDVRLDSLAAIQLRQRLTETAQRTPAVENAARILTVPFWRTWDMTLIVAVMGSFFFAMVALRGVGEVMLYVGLALALAASALYVRAGLLQVRTTR